MMKMSDLFVEKLQPLRSYSVMNYFDNLVKHCQMESSLKKSCFILVLTVIFNSSLLLMYFTMVLSKLT